MKLFSCAYFEKFVKNSAFLGKWTENKRISEYNQVRHTQKER